MSSKKGVNVVHEYKRGVDVKVDSILCITACQLSLVAYLTNVSIVNWILACNQRVVASASKVLVGISDAGGGRKGRFEVDWDGSMIYISLIEK